MCAVSALGNGSRLKRPTRVRLHPVLGYNRPSPKGGAMTELSQIKLRGDRARLFPVLAETSKEGRALSVLLACIANIQELGRALLSDVGQRVGARTKIDTYTEVTLQKGGPKAFRPDGLIVARGGSRQWLALVEAKVGNAELTTRQIEDYLDLGKQNGIDTLITLSNQYAPLPTHHPVDLPAAVRHKGNVFHWSWRYVLTQASLLLDNDEVDDSDQRVLLGELVRFLDHDSTGVKGFEEMPPAWANLVRTVHAGGMIATNAEDTRETVGAWHQEARDLNLILSRKLRTNVTTRISRAHATDPAARLKARISELAKHKCLETSMRVPDAAAPIEVRADLQTRSVSISMRLKAPTDRKSTKARTNWLLRQLRDTEDLDVYIRFFWPGRATFTQHTLAELRQDAAVASAGREARRVLSFEVLLVKDLGARFAQRRNFIRDLEAAVPEFYEQVGQYLKAWQPPAPRLREKKAEEGEAVPESTDAVGSDIVIPVAGAISEKTPPS
jgi:hypothetical protein